MKTLYAMVSAARRMAHRFHGHCWYYAPAQVIRGRRVGPWLICTPCDKVRRLEAEPPHTHPESMTGLSDQEERILSALDWALDWQVRITRMRGVS